MEHLCGIAHDSIAIAQAFASGTPVRRVSWNNCYLHVELLPANAQFRVDSIGIPAALLLLVEWFDLISGNALNREVLDEGADYLRFARFSNVRSAGSAEGEPATQVEL